MSIIRAYTLPHPPLAIPDIGHGKEREIGDTIAAFEEVSQEIAELKPEVIIYITPHSTLYADYFHISPGTVATGDFKRFGSPGTKLQIEYDEALAEEVSRCAGMLGIPAGGKGEKEPQLDHGTTVPMWFINKRYKDYKALRISQSGLEPAAHYRMGQAISEAVNNTGRRTVLIASSDLSHKLKDDGPYGFAPEGPRFDTTVVDAIKSGEFLTLMLIPEQLRERAAECGYNSLMVLAGCFDQRRVTARLLSYEGPFGVGYAVASFIPGEPYNERNILERFEGAALIEAKKKQDSEDAYRSLARQSLEHTLKNGGGLQAPEGLPDEMTKQRAGVFVSLHKNGRLRGCIGTIAPTASSIAEEIIQNAVSAGTRDSRFDPVTVSELPYIMYKVDVLSTAEPISGPTELDVKRYGVIVTSGFKRGLLLPNLDGIDTVEEQIAIARQKAGISKDAPIKLERFEVIRHE